MSESISPKQRLDFLRRGYSRRHFGRLALLTAAAGTGAALPFYNEFALAQRGLSSLRGLSSIPELPPDAVKINGNENPLGPCPEAVAAASAIIPRCGRVQLRACRPVRPSPGRVRRRQAGLRLAVPRLKRPAASGRDGLRIAHAQLRGR